MAHPDTQINSYLEQEVLSASPIRLRWMLIQRAEELCCEVERLWKGGNEPQANGWLLRIREILGELLEGVHDENNPVSQSVSDFYLYLLKLLSEIEATKDYSKLKTLSELLHLENETWQAVVAKFANSHSSTQNGSLSNSEPLFLSLKQLDILKSVDELAESVESLNLEI